MTDTFFGDFDDDDAFDTEPPDPEQVAIKLQRYRREHEASHDWEELTNEQRRIAIVIMGRLLEWLRRQGGIR